MNKYCNYHRHSQYSNLSSPDSTLTINDYIQRTKELETILTQYLRIKFSFEIPLANIYL